MCFVSLSEGGVAVYRLHIYQFQWRRRGLCVVYMFISFNGGGVACVFISMNRGGVACVHISHSKEAMAPIPVPPYGLSPKPSQTSPDK